MKQGDCQERSTAERRLTRRSIRQLGVRAACLRAPLYKQGTYDSNRRLSCAQSLIEAAVRAQKGSVEETDAFSRDLLVRAAKPRRNAGHDCGVVHGKVFGWCYVCIMVPIPGDERHQEGGINMGVVEDQPKGYAVTRCR